jgi:hypothetical protein
MKRFSRSIIITAAAVFICGFSYSLAATIEDFLIKDSTRTWLFSKDSIELGYLKSTYKGVTDCQGLEAHWIEEILDLDFTKIQAPAVISMHNNHYVDLYNAYIGDSMRVVANGIPQGLELVHRGDSLYGSARNVARNEVAMPLRPGMMALDNNMIDQMELIFALTDLNVGDTLSDTFFVAQFVFRAEFEFIVDSVIALQVGDEIDSVFAMRMLAPMKQNILFSHSFGLLKIIDPVQGFEITLIDKQTGQPYGMTVAKSSSGFFGALPLYLFYILVGLVFSIFVIKRYFNRLETYVMLILGAAGFSLLRYTQVPLQNWYGINYAIPGLQAGESLYYYAAVQALFSGLIQETLKLIPLILIMISRPPSKKSLVVLGMFTGMGFGIMEACAITGVAYKTGLMPFFSWGTFERIFAILFHTSTGAALGYAVAGGWKKVPAIWLLMVLIHSFSNLLIVFYQKEMIGLAPLELIVAAIDIVLAILVWLAVRGAARTDRVAPRPN